MKSLTGICMNFTYTATTWKRKQPLERLLGLLFIITITIMVHADDETPSHILLLVLQVALYSTLLSPNSCTSGFLVTPRVSGVLFSLLLHRTPKLSRRWIMCSRLQHESKPRHDSGPLSWADIPQLLFSHWPCNTHPKWHYAEAGRETLS